MYIKIIETLSLLASSLAVISIVLQHSLQNRSAILASFGWPFLSNYQGDTLLLLG
jgi:hypothetical protein